MASAHANIGKKALLDWIHEQFGLQYQKIEECASGAFYCQVMDAIYPGRVPMDKVNFNAKLEHEFLPNYKILQSVFTKENVPKAIDVPKLTKGKFQDNLEFLQWLKHYFDSHYAGQPYNANARRGDGTKPPSRKVSVSGAPTRSVRPSAPSSASPVHPKLNRTSPAPRSAVPPRPGAPTRTTADNASARAGENKLSGLLQRISELKFTLTQLDKDRNGLFELLRDVEILCQEDERAEHSSAKDKILEILYRADGEDVVVPAETDAAVRAQAAQAEPTADDYAAQDLAHAYASVPEEAGYATHGGTGVQQGVYVRETAGESDEVTEDVAEDMFHEHKLFDGEVLEHVQEDVGGDREGDAGYLSADAYGEAVGEPEEYSEERHDGIEGDRDMLETHSEYPDEEHHE